VFSFATTRNALQQQLNNGTITVSTTITVSGKDDRVLAWSPLELFGKIKNAYPSMLRESLLVRAVSQMENYLVEMIAEVARRDLTPFKRQDKTITLTQAHLLSFATTDQLRAHLIDAECRVLNGKGFREFEKYYKKRFNIAFTQASVSVEHIDEIYARRHILVHAGGIVDEQYCRRFASHMQPGERLIINEDYFLDAIQKLQSLAEFSATRIDALFPDPGSPAPPPVEKLLKAFGTALHQAASQIPQSEIAVAHWFAARFGSPELLTAHFSDASTFGFDVARSKVASIVVGSHRISETTMHWLICAPKALAGAYIGYLVFMSRKGMIEEFEKHHISLLEGRPTLAN
jgi:hypothetical protein